MLLFKLIVIFPILMVQVKCQHPDYVLPNNVKPSRYVITIHSFNTTNFKGSVEIELEALEETSNITLHAKNIEIDNNLISITGENGKEVKWKDTSTETEKEFYIINLSENLDKGKVYNLTINEYTGSLTEAKEGFFSARHIDANGTVRRFFMTEFEPSHARKAFPCFDQPNFKAKFTMKIIRPSDLRSAFNTPLLETIDLGNGTQMDVFKETPLMPTYIVAFIVSDFEYTRASDIVRILAPVEHTQGDSTNFILEESVKILRALEEYTGIKYPLDKLDLVAVPQHYYLDGAMENWGLITYSDKYLVCPKSYSNREMQKCLTFTAHEISHQWFGNLATQKAWNYIWLSEGFASYFQYYISDVVKPSWRIMEQYVLEEYEVSLKSDVDFIIDFVYTSPDSYPDPNVFYRKASAIIRMVQHILTDEIHRNGLRIYLQNNKFKNTEPIDLYNSYQQALEDANATHLLGNSSIHEILSSWVKNPAYPLITVTRDYDNGKVTFSQKVFSTYYDEGEVLWHVPITYALESSKEHFDFNKTTADVWLTQENITIDLGTNDGWILVNKHATGYYRVNYDERNWERVTNYLRSKNVDKIPPVNRATLLYDAYTMAKQSQIQYETFFNLSLYLEQEIDYIPISAFIDILEDADVVKVGQYKFDAIKQYLAKLFSASYKRIESTPWDNDTHIDGLRRILLQKIMCEIDQDDCVKRALDVFASWRNTGELGISKDLSKSWLCAAMKGAHERAWEFLLQRYYLSNDTVSRMTYIYALNCAKDASLLQRFLKIVFDLNDPMYLKDKMQGLTQIVETHVGANLFMDYILSVDVDDRFCAYFSEAESIFIPATPNEREKLIVIFPILMVQVKCQHPDYVLPKNVKPSRYVITIHSFNTTNFKGSVEIELEALEETSNITLHAKNIEIDNNLISITGENGKEVKWKDTSTETEKDFYIINLSENLNKGKVYNLTINEYTGSLTEVKNGFFSGKHTGANGTERLFFMTEFQSSYARKALPCFDQPNFKATFTMKIIRPSDLRSAFNTPLLETIDLGNGTQMDVFKETPVMPTYIVAFIVSDFEYTRASDVVRILAPVEHTQDDSTNFVLEESVKILRALEEYTGIKYALDKLDLVAVPQQYYVNGAMENWGLITYSDEYLVCPKTYSNSEIQKCLTLTAHEISHQWFGNLATQKAWNYMWLSEGFASYFQYYISDVVKPSWRIMEQYVLEEYEDCLKSDLYFRIDFVYKSPDSFPDQNVFYRKASAIIRMVQHILTDEIHRNGLRIYLQNNKFKNTEPIDLYNSYQQAVEDANATHLLGNSSIHDILSSWVKNPAYPLVTVTRDYDNGKVTFSQERFNKYYGEEALWHVPITYELESSKEHFDFNKTTADIWLTQKNITIDLGTNDGWILVNKHATGYYRVNYDERNWERLTNYLRSKNYDKIPPVNRATLLYDAYTMAKTNQIQYETFFNLTLYLEQEIDYIPISAFINILEEADVVTRGQCKFDAIKLLTTITERILRSLRTMIKSMEIAVLLQNNTCNFHFKPHKCHHRIYLRITLDFLEDFSTCKNLRTYR
ncbi:hypothetical protein RI129_000236 [Pyrocoelia pectoralis]|uniref:Aminopeptidase N n=1 Tax=Pyrocoelia pectoralis TaxID=417401 RepID=A0AAN7ZNQ3_9COLE